MNTSRIAAIYARVSTDRQSQLSTADQSRKCREYAAAHGFEVRNEHIYVDEAMSGVGSDRPAFQKMMSEATSFARPISAILVDDTSRLSRSTEDALGIFRRLHFAGIQMIAVSQGIDSNDDQADVLVTVHGMVDSLYVKELAKKTHRGLEGLALRGLHTGGRCYGYEAVSAGEGTSKRLAINPTQGTIVQRIFELSASGSSFKAIAKQLNAECVEPPRPRGRHLAAWCPTAIRAMLKRELYRGEVIWNRSKFEKVPGTNRRHKKMRDESQWKRVEHPELAIVSIELWERVQRRLKTFSGTHRGGSQRGLLPRSLTSPYLFSGILKCGECGGNLIIATGGGTHRRPKYVCSNYFNRGVCGNRLYIRRDYLEERLLGKIQSELLRPEVIEYTIKEFSRQLRLALDNLGGEIVQMRQRKTVLEIELRRYADAIGRGGNIPALIEQMNARQGEVNAIADRLMTSSPDSLEARIKDIRQFVGDQLQNLTHLLNQDAILAKMELRKHLEEVRMLPTQNTGDWHYVAEGSWNLVGSGAGPRAPVLPLAHSDGCGGWI
jgi:site-specific DNA recombinase